MLLSTYLMMRTANRIPPSMASYRMDSVISTEPQYWFLKCYHIDAYAIPAADCPIYQASYVLIIS